MAADPRCAAVGIGVTTMLDRPASSEWAAKSPLRPDEPELNCTCNLGITVSNHRAKPTSAWGRHAELSGRSDSPA
jgi:hypothetical protein